MAVYANPASTKPSTPQTLGGGVFFLTLAPAVFFSNVGSTRGVPLVNIM